MNMKIDFTIDELKLIQFFIQHRNDKNLSDLYQEFRETIGDTHVGIKVSKVLSNYEIS